MAHIDFKVENLQVSEEHALKCGALKADVQYYVTSTVMLDPAGHPFYLSTVQQKYSTNIGQQEETFTHLCEPPLAASAAWREAIQTSTFH